MSLLPSQMKAFMTIITELFSRWRSDVEVRLAYGMSPNKGVLQVRCQTEPRWSAVCTDMDASPGVMHRLACRQLGFYGRLVGLSLPVRLADMVGMERLQTIDGIRCSGDEVSLRDCRRSYGPCQALETLECFRKCQ